jgi:hypothetical protein
MGGGCGECVRVKRYTLADSKGTSGPALNGDANGNITTVRLARVRGFKPTCAEESTRAAREKGTSVRTPCRRARPEFMARSPRRHVHAGAGGGGGGGGGTRACAGGKHPQRPRASRAPGIRPRARREKRDGCRLRGIGALLERGTGYRARAAAAIYGRQRQQARGVAGAPRPERGVRESRDACHGSEATATLVLSFGPVARGWIGARHSMEPPPRAPRQRPG